MISTISKGSRVAGDGCLMDIFGEAPTKRILRIPARVRYQARLVKRSVTVVGIVVKRRERCVSGMAT